MAEGNGDSNGSSHADNSFGFLTKKIGPLPVWMWAALAVGVYYWYTHYGPGATSSATGQASAAGTANVDQITVQPNFGGSHYKTNAEWEDAALNYLVGESVPPDQASAALFNYLHSKALNTQEQEDVNLAIEGIGPPPEVPAPAVTPIPVDRGPKPPKPPKPPHPHPRPIQRHPGVPPPGKFPHEPKPRHVKVPPRRKA